MTSTIAIAALALASASPQAEAEARVHERVRGIMAANAGRALFSEVYNAADLAPADREYAARLYEVFFALPGYLAREQRARGRAPTAEEIAGDFGLSPAAVALLLEIATSDPRLPALLTLGPSRAEIASLDLEALDDFASKKGGSVKVAGWEGRPLPDFELTALDGRVLRAAALRGRPTLVFLWLTRCPICRRVTPEVVRVAELYRERGLQVVGLCADEVLGLDVPAAERAAWLEEQHVTYRNAVLDPAVRAALGDQNIFPAFFLVAADGVVARLVINQPAAGVLAAMVEDLLD